MQGWFRLVTLAFGLVVLAGAFTACGPDYPKCTNDDHCKEKNEVCVNGLCKDCNDDAKCAGSDPCQQCGSDYRCGKRPGCCKSDLDCPGGRCWEIPNHPQKLGECGPQCKDDSHCPEGQMCQGGNCVPRPECGPDKPCPPGKECVNGFCQKAACDIKTVYFDFNEYAIRLDQEESIRGNVQCLQSGSWKVEGHCDERGSDEYNLALGQRRANAVVRQYKKLGVSGNNLTTISYGEERPTCNQSNEECWWQNRRAETVRN